MITNEKNTVNSTRGKTFELISRNLKTRRLFLLRLVCLALVTSLLSPFTLGLAQGQEGSKEPANKTEIVTASVTPDGVRIAAPNAVARLRLEVYDNAGQKLLDTEQAGGNLLDWHLQASTGERIADGTYLLVVTIENPGKQLSQKLGLMTVSAQSTTLRAAASDELSAQQAQVTGSLGSEVERLTVVPAENTPPVTVLANTGDEAQLTSTRGPLTFRSGDFFSGTDKEQMRITPDGRVGIGTVNPQATLDVAGTVRAQDGIVFGDGSVLKSANDLRESKTTVGVNNVNGVTPGAGTGTAGKLSKWIDGAGNLGDSVITEQNGNIGIGTTSPASALHLSAPGGASAMTLDTPGSQKFRFQTVPNVPNWGALTLNANYNNGWNLDDQNTNGWFFKLDTRGGNAASDSNGLWLWRVPNGANPHTNEYPVFGVTNGRAYFADNVGINTTAPTQKLDVGGNIKISGAGNGLIFPDGSKMTTASAGGGTPSGTNIVSAINDPATTGTIADARLSNNVARLSNPNTFAASQAVNGSVAASGHVTAGGNVTANGLITAGGSITAGGPIQSNSGGFQFPDGTVQTTAVAASSAGLTYTTFPSGPFIEIGKPITEPGGGSVEILRLNDLPAGSYMVTATIQFENKGLFNKRLVACQVVDEGGWYFRIEGAGGAMDQQPVTIHTVINHGGTIRVYCSAIDGSGRSNIWANMRRLTAVRLGSVAIQ